MPWSTLGLHASVQLKPMSLGAYLSYTQVTSMHYQTHYGWYCYTIGYLVVADMSLLHSGNKIADAGLTELSAALRVNHAITNLDLERKLLGDLGIRVCTPV